MFIITRLLSSGMHSPVRDPGTSPVDYWYMYAVLLLLLLLLLMLWMMLLLLFFIPLSLLLQ